MTVVRRRPPRGDVVLATAFLAASLLQVAIAPIAAPAVSVLVAVWSTVPVAWRRVAPVAAALAGSAAWLVPTPEGFLLLGYVVAGVLFYSVGIAVPEPWRVALVTGVGVTVGVVTTLLGPEDPPVAIGSALAVAAPAAAGRLVAHQRQQTARLRALTEDLVRQRAAAERAAAAEERTRIARELHDVIGHEVTVIALQADAAAAALAVAPERAREPVERIRTAAQETLDEMRRVVGLLRDPADPSGGGPEEDGDLRPLPTLAELPGLVERARVAGMRVELTVVPPPAPPPPGLQLAAYRVVQESLTNARRHAPGSTVLVRVDGAGDALEVEVLSTGGSPAGGPAGISDGDSGGGHGLAGMRERVRLHGGRLDARPTGDGWSVTARLPLTPQPVP